LLSHYDSAPFGFTRASDGLRSGNNIRSVRAFQNSKSQLKNDIIILFSDAEELGLNGCRTLFMGTQLGKRRGRGLI
jgi:hypothetical protein